MSVPPPSPFNQPPRPPGATQGKFGGTRSRITGPPGWKSSVAPPRSAQWGAPRPANPWAPPALRGGPQPSAARGRYGPPANWGPGGGRSGWGPSRPRKSSGLLVGCLVTVVALIVLVPALVAFALAVSSVDDPYEPPTPRPGTQPPTPPTPTSTPSTPAPVPPTPKAEPPQAESIPDRTFPPLPPPDSNDPAWVTVQQAAVYKAAFPDMTGCPGPTTVGTMEELQPYASAQLACIQNAWRPVLASVGLPSHEIPHFFYAGSDVTTPCGTVSAPAYYCSADGGTIHFGDDLLLDTSWDPIWAKDVIGHEYGHHIQGVSGFFNAMYSLPEGNETIRRSEIQATCLSMGMLRHDDAITVDRLFYDTLEPHLRSYLDDGTHGSKDSLAHWGMRGFHADLAGECTTWLAGPELVE